MSINRGKLASGTELHQLDSEGTAITSTFGNILSFGDISQTRTDIDVTTLSDKAKRYMPGNVEGGEISLELVATEESYAILSELFNETNPSLFGVTFPISALDKKFSGYLKQLDIIGIEQDSILRLSAILKIDGEISKFTKPLGE